ncbi:MAG: restriction endonuclease subunit S [Burkholderiales bacterium]|nr:restriction endonuclease subunit S [Burkholderiales bacterium]
MDDQNTNEHRPLALTPINPGPTPNDWKIKTIGEVSHRVTNGFVGSSLPHQVEEGITYLQGFNVRPSKIELKNRTFVSREFHKLNNKSQLKAGDVLVVQSGHIGTAARVPEEFGEANCHALIIVDLRRDKVVPDYLVEHLNSPIGRARMRGLHVGSSILHINTSELAKYRLPLPSLDEQRKIAEILQTWDEAIEKLEALRAANEARYKAISKRFFDACHPSFHGRPNAWQQYELGDVFRERSQSSEGNDRLLSITMSSGVIDREEVGRKDTSTDDKSSYKLILPGDIGYNTMRMWQGVSGLSALRGIISPAYTVITPISSRILGRYAAHLFKSRRMVFDFERYSQGLTSDTWNLKFPTFSRIKVFLPPIEDQKKQADLLDSLTAEGSVISKQHETLTRQKRGLMQKLLTGEWRVHP